MVNVLIIEDEQPAAQRLERMLAEVAPDFIITSRCDSIESSILFFSNSPMPDLVFLDIQLGDGLSFEIFKKVNITSPIIFTTAYDEFALKAFELNSIDYILKPIEKEKLAKSIDKFRKIHASSSIIEHKLLESILDTNKHKFKQRFIVYCGEHIVAINVDEIAYFSSMEKSTFIFTTHSKMYSIDYSLDKLEKLLNQDVFFRANRNFIIAYSSISKIYSLSKSRIKIEVIPAFESDILISASRTHDFKLWLDR
jgi:DNA-binding LytR/AlgR family response regulator